MSSLKAANRIGITTTVPSEVLLAAGYTPVDLNNIFITNADPGHLISIAEKDGFPLNCCAWIKGIYGACLEHNIGRVICVTSGDCSNTEMLMEVLRLKGVEAIPFAFPQEPDTVQMEASLISLAQTLDTSLEVAEKVRQNLLPARRLAAGLDRLTWQEGLASGQQNHYWLVSSSDFNGSPEQYAKELQAEIEECRKRQPYSPHMLRLAYIGVPAVYDRHLYKYLEENGARVVFNEIQRQFSMPGEPHNLAEQYCSYTYPYSTKERIRDIKSAIKERSVDAVIHYVQAFCHRAIGDILFRQALDAPVLTIEGNNNFFLSQHLRTRIEASLDIIKHRKEQQNCYNKTGGKNR